MLRLRNKYASESETMKASDEGSPEATTVNISLYSFSSQTSFRSNILENNQIENDNQY